MWFGVLGPLLVLDEDRVIGVPGGRQRVLLAALLVRAGAVVPADALAEMMWDGAPPAGAVTTLRSHVMRLRRVLGQAAGARIVTRYPGYAIQAGQDEVDVLRFGGLCREGAGAVRAGEWPRVWEVLGEALGLWRGEPLGDIPSELLRRDEVPGLEQLRLQAVEWRMDAGLHLGRQAELMPELQSLTARHPLRERFHAQLMLALVRCGRQAEALETYQRARKALVEELGTDPGSELRDLHQRILADDPALGAFQSATPAGNGAESAVPRELPAPVAHFAGRAKELAALTGLVDRCAERTPEAIVISAIGGTAGVGKTALAVHWAHQVADRFPDGQLYVNLRGYDPDQPMTASDALAGFLRALGVPGQDIPAEEAERAARYRSLLAGKRVLVVLDNAGSVEQVRPLLPGCPACAVLVTSRDSLAGLVARDGAVRLDLDLLPLADAVALLRALIGERVAEDPRSAALLAAQCCRLPLALRVTAELAVTRPDVSLARLTAELTDQQERLDLLDADGDPGTAVRAVFSWSYRHLNADAARAFRLLGLHPGPGFEAYAAAALTGTSLLQGRRALDVLARAHLIQAGAPGRYGMHDLLRAYARFLSDVHDGEERQHAALTRLFDHYLHAVATVAAALHPVAGPHPVPIPSAPVPAPAVSDAAAARAWLDAELATLTAVTVHTAEHGWPAHATRLAHILFYYLDLCGHLAEAITIHGHACTAARHAGDHAAEAIALNHLAAVNWGQSRYQQATVHLQQALALFQQLGDRAGQAQVLGNLGILHSAQGRYQQAIRLHEQALILHREAGNRLGEAHTLGNLGDAKIRQGRYQQAAEHHRQSLAVAQEIGTQHTVGTALVNLGTVGLHQGSYDEAADCLDRALAIFRETGYRSGEAEALARIGDVCLRQGRPEEAAGHLHESLALYRAIGNRSGQADALNSIGDVMLAAGGLGDARPRHAAALSLASQIGDDFQKARAHYGLGQAHHAGGDLARAVYHWRQALALYNELGIPEADQVRAQLARYQALLNAWPP